MLPTLKNVSKQLTDKGKTIQITILPQMKSLLLLILEFLKIVD